MSLDFLEMHFRYRRTLTANSKVCTGCRTCEVVCTLYHGGIINLEQSRLHIRANPLKGSFNPTVCHQCSDAPCYFACPISAINIEKEFGTVQINERECSGCGACIEACPFKVIRLDEGANKAFKCDFCHGSPECARWCPVNALGVAEFGGAR